MAHVESSHYATALASACDGLGCPCLGGRCRRIGAVLGVEGCELAAVPPRALSAWMSREHAAAAKRARRRDRRLSRHHVAKLPPAAVGPLGG